MRSCNYGAIFEAFLGGALVGGAIAILTAPRSGAETRGMIRDFIDDEAGVLKDRAAAARDYVEDRVERYKRKARRAARDTEGFVGHAAERVEDEIEAVRRAAGR